MSRVFNLVVVGFMVIGMGFLTVSVGTNFWRERDGVHPNFSIHEGLFRGCGSGSGSFGILNNTFHLDTCTNLWSNIDNVPDKFIAVTSLMLLAILFILLASLIGCCTCLIGKSARILIFIAAIITFVSVSCSLTGLSIYVHEYRDNHTIRYSYYLGWVGTALNLASIPLQCCLASKKQDGFSV